MAKKLVKHCKKHRAATSPMSNREYLLYAITDNMRKSSHYISDCQNNCPVIVKRKTTSLL